MLFGKFVQSIMKHDHLVTCPNCKHQFDIESALTADLQQSIDNKLRNEYNAKYKTKMEEVEKEIDAKKKALETQLKQQLASEHEAMIKALQTSNIEQEEKIKNLRKIEVEKMQLEQQLKNDREMKEIETKKLLMEQEIQLKEKLGKEADQKNELKIKEMEKQMEDQKKLIEEMKRKAEQGSMQMQGEVQELALEDMLKQTFPLDQISEVAKGVKGADMIQTVVNSMGHACGKIIWESKRTKDFQPSWIEKFKTDLRQSGGDIGVIVTQAMPKDMTGFGLKDGIYICPYEDAKSLAVVLRNSILRVSEVIQSNDNKEEKMHLLYTYLTGTEFKHQMEAITEGFMSMKKSLMTERVAMEKLWKEREKQLDKVLINAGGMYGSVKGIAGSAVSEIKGLELGADSTESEEL